MDCDGCESNWLHAMILYGVNRCCLDHLGTVPEIAVGRVYGDNGGGVKVCRSGGVASERSCEVRKRVFKATGVGDGKWL